MRLRWRISVCLFQIVRELELRHFPLEIPYHPRRTGLPARGIHPLPPHHRRFPRGGLHLPPASRSFPSGSNPCPRFRDPFPRGRNLPPSASSLLPPGTRARTGETTPAPKELRAFPGEASPIPGELPPGPRETKSAPGKSLPSHGKSIFPSGKPVASPVEFHFSLGKIRSSPRETLEAVRKAGICSRINTDSSEWRLLVMDLSVLPAETTLLFDRWTTEGVGFVTRLKKKRPLGEPRGTPRQTRRQSPARHRGQVLRLRRQQAHRDRMGRHRTDGRLLDRASIRKT